MQGASAVFAGSNQLSEMTLYYLYILIDVPISVINVLVFVCVLSLFGWLYNNFDGCCYCCCRQKTAAILGDVELRGYFCIINVIYVTKHSFISCIPFLVYIIFLHIYF